MTQTNELDLNDFARRVERLCDFLLAQVERDGSEDLGVIEKLKENAADIQFNRIQMDATLEGLHEYVNGLDAIPNKQ